MDLDGLFNYLQNKYPNHNFAWRQHGKIWVGFCPAHEDQKTPNFTIMPNEGSDDYHAFCFACGHFEPVGEQTPLMRDLATMKAYLKEQLENKESIYSKYLCSRVLELDDEEAGDELKKELLGLDIFAYDYALLNKLTDETLKEKIQQIAILNNHLQEFLVFTYRNTKNQVVALKFRNVTISKADREWAQWGIKTIKLATNESGYFNVQALYSKYPVLLVVEGEFDAITTMLVAGEQYPAISVGGTSGFTVENLKPVLKIAGNKDKAVFLTPDWDEAGMTALQNFIKRIDKKFIEHKKIFTFSSYYNTAKSIKIKDLDELLRGHLENAAETMEDLAKHAKPLMLYKEKVEKEEKKAEEQERQEIINSYPDNIIGLLEQKEITEIKIGAVDLPYQQHFILEPFIPFRSIVLFDGLGETGKSLLAMQLALCVASGKPFLNSLTNKQKTFYFTAEEDEYAFNDRLIKLMKGLNITNDDLAGNFRWLSVFSENFKCPIYRLFEIIHGGVEKTAFYDYLLNIIAHFSPQLVILDSLVNLYGLDENNSSHASIFMESLKMIAKNYNCSFFVLHHQTKEAMRTDGERIFRGSMVFRDQARERITLQKINCNVKKIEIEKLNFYTKMKKEVYLKLATTNENNEPILCFYETDKPVETKKTNGGIPRGEG